MENILRSFARYELAAKQRVNRFVAAPQETEVLTTVSKPKSAFESLSSKEQFRQIFGEEAPSWW